jgi:hypothetical protein
MATYKVIQDVEAEDKLVGPLTLRQFIYAGIAALSAYLGFLFASKGAAFMLGVFIPITIICGFFAFPWGRDQPTEIWALAKIRFLLKPRRRIWDQSGTKDLVTVTVPKAIDLPLTNGLNQDEVHSRLQALADTIDSRGWAIKNVNVNLSTPTFNQTPESVSDRLVQASSLPQEVSNVDVSAADDILDESANPIAQHFYTMTTAADVANRERLIAQMQQPATVTSTPPPTQAQPATQLQSYQQPQANAWFLQSQTPTVNTAAQTTFNTDPVVAPGTPAQSTQGIVQAAVPTAAEEALIAKLKAENSASGVDPAYGHMKTLKTPEQLMEEARMAAATPPVKPEVTPADQAAIMEFAKNNDWTVATIARQAHDQVSNDDNEVVIALR